ncbi:unnamed protein product [Coccothraustes coccothraustes]
MRPRPLPQAPSASGASEVYGEEGNALGCEMICSSGDGSKGRTQGLQSPFFPCQQLENNCSPKARERSPGLLSVGKQGRRWPKA